MFGIPVDTINAISQIGFTGGAILIIGLLLTGKLVAGYLLDRSDTRADKLQSSLDAAAAVNAQFPKAISDLQGSHSTEVDRITASHEREIAQVSNELRRLQDMLQPHG